MGILIGYIINNRVHRKRKKYRQGGWWGYIYLTAPGVSSVAIMMMLTLPIGTSQEAVTSNEGKREGELPSVI